MHLIKLLKVPNAQSIALERVEASCYHVQGGIVYGQATSQTFDFGSYNYYHLAYHQFLFAWLHLVHACGVGYETPAS